MTDPTDIPEDDDGVLAGELALRLLSPEDEAAALARAERDAAFAAQVEAWNDRFAAFADQAPAATPASGVWARISAALDAPASASSSGAAPAANDNGRVAFWRGWALGSTGLLAASLAAVGFLALQPPATVEVPAAAQPPVLRVATLTLQEGGQPALTLVYDAASGELYLAPTEQMAGEDGVPHLWLVMPEGGVQLVGSIDGSATSRRRLDAVLSGRAGQANAVAISIEAPGVTPPPTQPGGPVVAQGVLQPV